MLVIQSYSRFTQNKLIITYKKESVHFVNISATESQVSGTDREPTPNFVQKRIKD